MRSRTSLRGRCRPASCSSSDRQRRFRAGSEETPDAGRVTVPAIRDLVVEDEADLALVLTRMLALEGWATEAAGDGNTALRLAAAAPPDVVVLDVMLPDMTGLQVLRHLRAVNPAVCILFLTARDSVEDRVAGITAGGDDYLTKPFAMEEL